jgi:chemotaxis regulatin CheY-phosphate phosphatase CheZ
LVHDPEKREPAFRKIVHHQCQSANRFELKRMHSRRRTMAQSSNRPTDFTRALGDARKEAGGVADAVTDAAQDLYGHARDSAADVANVTNTAARKAAGSLEQAIRHTIETQPYTAAAIALGLGWFLGRMHRPL